MEQSTQTNGAPLVPTGHIADTRQPRLVAFDPHQRETVMKAFQQYMAVVSTVASCMGLKQARLDDQLTGFLVDE